MCLDTPPTGPAHRAEITCIPEKERVAARTRRAPGPSLFCLRSVGPLPADVAERGSGMRKLLRRAGAPRKVRVQGSDPCGTRSGPWRSRGER